MATDDLDCDLAILGGGLSGGLIALAFAAKRPDVRLLLIEKGERPGGNHIWSFFDGDVAPQDRWLVDPLIAQRWPQGHAVRFPNFTRQLPTPYNSANSVQFATHLAATLGDCLLTSADVTVLTCDSVTLADGRAIRAGAIIDAGGNSNHHTH